MKLKVQVWLVILFCYFSRGNSEQLATSMYGVVAKNDSRSARRGLCQRHGGRKRANEV
jgi:hypothetical protein